MDEQLIFQQIVAPAVLIPACGLLLMSSTVRLNTVLARIRSFHTERLAIWQTSHGPGTPAETVRILRLEGLEYQAHRLLRRAGLLRVTLVLLFLAIGSNLVSALGLVALFLTEGTDVSILNVVPGAAFTIGIVFLLGATVSSILEVVQILDTVRYEHERVERLCEADPCPDTGEVGPDGRQGAGLGL